MRTPRAFPALAVTAVFALLLTPDTDPGQPLASQKEQKPKPPPDEFKSFVKEVEEAYKAPFEVDKDILDELRKQYKNPTPERELKILREARRLYNLTPEQEQDIIRELRLAYGKPSPEQEERIFQTIRRNGQLPPGTVPLSTQVERAAKLFGGFDRDGDGRLSSEEMPENLRAQFLRWDRNGDGVIDFTEYGNYYQANLQVVSQRVASGEIAIKLPRGATLPSQPPSPLPLAPPMHPQVLLPTQPGDAPRDAQPVAIRYGKLPPGLPAWFLEYDTDKDGQVGLYEWRQQGRPIAEFGPMDRNGDFLITPEEMLFFLAAQARERNTDAAEFPAPGPRR
jgi:hypothetical protein